MGALVYEPYFGDVMLSSYDKLDIIADEILQFQKHNDVHFIEELLFLNGSSSGASPKIVININGEGWIVKFRSLIDPKDMGFIEYVYHLMAKEANVDVPEAKIFQFKKGPGYFGAKRFDRVDRKRLHMHTISGLLHVDHSIPNLDYETIIKATMFITKDVRECEKQFRAAVFNILSHNRDDHAKNFSFLMNENNVNNEQ